MRQPPPCPSECLHVVGAALIEGGRCLVVRRGPEMSTPLKWEFPGGKVEAGESPRVALQREIREELALDVEVRDWVGRGSCATGSGSLILDVYHVRRLAGSLHLREHAEHRWLEAGELEALDWAEPDVPIIAPLRAFLDESQ